MHPLPSVASRALAAAGLLCLLLGAGTLVVQPLLLKAPLQQSSTTTSTGSASFRDNATGRLLPGTFRQTSTVTTHRLQGRRAGTAAVASYDQRSVETFTPAGGRERPLMSSSVTQAFDRRTGAGRPGAQGDTLGTTAHLLKLPFGTQRRDDVIWDVTAKRAVPLRFTGERAVDGLRVLVFSRDVGPTDLGVLPLFRAVPGSWVGHPELASVPAHEWYETTATTLYVEPVTGSLVGGASSLRVWAQTTGPLGGRTVDLLTVSGATPDKASATQLLARARHAKAQVLALRRAPWLLGAAGAVLGLLGLLVGRRGRSGPATTSQDNVSSPSQPVTAFGCP